MKKIFMIICMSVAPLTTYGYTNDAIAAASGIGGSVLMGAAFLHSKSSPQAIALCIGGLALATIGHVCASDKATYMYTFPGLFAISVSCVTGWISAGPEK